MHTFASVAVVDPRGWILMQERDEHAPVDPDKWGLPGGGLESGEDFRTAAARELEEETGLVVPAEDLESLGVTRFFNPPCDAVDEFELFVARLEVTEADVVCGEGRQMVFVEPARILDLDLVEAARRSVPLVLRHVIDGPAIVLVALRDARGRLLMQERDDHAPTNPLRWSFPGGQVEPGESAHAAALRELEEETGLTGIELRELAVDSHFIPPWGDVPYAIFVGQADLRDEDVECHEGRQMVFCEPAEIASLDLTRSTARFLPLLVGAEQHRFVGVILVDREGHILLQERDEHPRIDPDTWGLCGGHLDPGEDFEPAAYRELEEETGVSLTPGTLELWGDFVVDHREAYGTWDRMQVFVAATDLGDADIDCREGRQIVFVEPHEIAGRDLTRAAADILPAFLDSAVHHRLSTRPEEAVR